MKIYSPKIKGYEKFTPKFKGYENFTLKNKGYEKNSHFPLPKMPFLFSAAYKKKALKFISQLMKLPTSHFKLTWERFSSVSLLCFQNIGEIFWRSRAPPLYIWHQPRLSPLFLASFNGCLTSGDGRINGRTMWNLKHKFLKENVNISE